VIVHEYATGTTCSTRSRRCPAITASAPTWPATTAVSRGLTAIQVAHQRGGRNYILEHVGTARAAGELAVLKAEARRRLRPGVGDA